jgi:hypothetical protein
LHIVADTSLALSTATQALDQIGALLRMVLIVIRDMRYFIEHHTH